MKDDVSSRSVEVAIVNNGCGSKHGKLFVDLAVGREQVA